MEEIKVYKTSDGKLFEDKDKAKEHENVELFKEAISNFVSTHINLHQPELEEVISEIIVHCDELKEIFDKYAGDTT